MQRTVARVLEEKETTDQPVLSAHPDDSVYEALVLMADKNVGALIVMDGERLAGIMSERDYARKIILLNRDSRETKVSDIMTGGVGVPENGAEYTVGPWLSFDPESERHTGEFADTANVLLRDPVNKGFDIPSIYQA